MLNAKTAAADLDSRVATEAAGRRVHEAEVVRNANECADRAVEFAAHVVKRTRQLRGKDRPTLTLGNILHFVVGILFLWPLLLVVGAVTSIGHVVALIRSTAEAVLSTTFWFGMLIQESMAGLFSHKDDPQLLKLRGSRRAFWHEASRDWSNAGKALVGIGRRFSGAFGLGGLFTAFEQRIQRASADWHRYVVASTPAGATPGDFPEDYVIVDQLTPGGSSARLYIARKKGEDGVVDAKGPLFVIKYFDLMQGGNLESVVRESQAAELAKKLGLIIESNLGTRAFWYVMPYYEGHTLTRATLDSVKEARKQGARAVYEQQRLSLGWLHQVLQIIAQYHEAGVFHKDIKPDNLIVNGERIYLVDIGLMTPLASMHQLTTHGTEYFRDPEMVKLALEGREVRQVNASKFDIYSIGAVLYFAIEGEFPTSGPLSRFSPDVPLAVQWVANRAMAGMNQRYETARQMLTDVDYLCWAAAQGMLDQVKPADLPSFRGMPVPQHLMPPGQSSGYVQMRHVSPGGYGAWYMAPTFKVQNRGGVRNVAIGVGVLLLFAGGSFYMAWQQDKLNGRRGLPVPEQQLSSRLPEPREDLVFLYDQIEGGLKEQGVVTATNQHARVDQRNNLVPKVLQVIDSHVSADLPKIERDRRDRAHRVKPAFLRSSIIFLCADTDPADTELAAGIEREFNLEVARTQRNDVPPISAADRAELTQLVSSISDPQALHREIATRFAKRGLAPSVVVFFTLDMASKTQFHLRTITPGYEWRDEIPFNNG